MKRFVVKLAIFLLLFIVVDYAVGKYLELMEFNAISGHTHKNIHICSKTHEDILIFGSSRSHNHYNPNIIEEKMKMSCYNCGEDESGINLFYPRWKMISNRYIPKIIIYDIYYQDILKIDKNAYLSVLKPYYHTNQTVDSILNKDDTNLKYKMMSDLYKYNSRFVDIIRDRLVRADFYDKGFYTGNHGSLSSNIPKQLTDVDIDVDENRLALMEKFIQDCSGKTQLIFAISPTYIDMTEKMFAPVLKLADKYNIPVLNHYCDTIFTNHPEYFQNGNHMNVDGAKLYTNLIVQEIKQINSQID